MKSFIKNFFLRPPVIFPLVACFLVFLSLNEIVITVFSGEVDLLYKVRGLLMILMTIFWIAATLFKKWGALAFVILTIISVGTYFYVDSLTIKSILGNLLILYLPFEKGSSVPIPLSIIFSFIALFYYNRMN
ncbi:MAG TPA: hypothetical protein VLZ83_01965 [Edaphocola sp.]|nr:hypothetical protein [Edaphocola sp.]